MSQLAAYPGNVTRVTNVDDPVLRVLSHDPGPDGYTVADLHALPDEGPRYELIGGSIVVSPSATTNHNVIAHWIGSALDATNPDDDLVVGFDQSTNKDDHNEVRPDVTVADVSVLDVTPFPINKLVLAVEVISPQSSWVRDTETKRALYARAGVPAYWIVVPEADSATIAMAELVLDPETKQYAYHTHFTSEAVTVEHPWRLTLDLPALTERRARLIERANSKAADDDG